MGDVFGIPRLQLTDRARAKILEIATTLGFRPTLRLYDIYEYKRDELLFSYKFDFPYRDDIPGDWKYCYGEITIFLERLMIVMLPDTKGIPRIPFPDGKLDFVEKNGHQGFKLTF